MTYGDGTRPLYPLTSLDVAGHEMTHGVTSNTAGLIYSGESGGLNEATSDIFGSMVEYYANNANDPGDYKIGEEIFRNGTSVIRYMYKPSADGVSADCWYPGVGNIDVHYSSGIANHFYYMLAEGTDPAGGPTSPTCVAGNTRVGHRQRLPGRHRSHQGREDLVRGAHAAHDHQHQLCAGSHRDAERSQRPLRRWLRRVKRRGSCLVGCAGELSSP